MGRRLLLPAALAAVAAAGCVSRPCDDEDWVRDRVRDRMLYASEQAKAADGRLGPAVAGMVVSGIGILLGGAIVATASDADGRAKGWGGVALCGLGLAVEIGSYSYHKTSRDEWRAGGTIARGSPYPTTGP